MNPPEGPDPNPPRLAADGLPPLSAVIKMHDLRAKKSLGQNFILDLNLTRRIARSCGALEGRMVVEVGPGPGGLTRALLFEGARDVIAIERDFRCLPALAEIGQRWPGQLHVVHDDALEADWPSLIAPYTGAGALPPYLIANLPYGIATKLLIGWLTEGAWPPWYGAMALMFQKEVAERIAAEPGTKAYGRLAVLAQWRCEVDIALTLPPQAFTPAPKVSSAVVVLRPREAPLDVVSGAALSKVTRAVFGQRRKMLRVSLRQISDSPEDALARAGLSPQARGEDIDVAGFVRLTNAVYLSHVDRSHDADPGIIE